MIVHGSGGRAVGAAAALLVVPIAFPATLVAASGQRPGDPPGGQPPGVQAAQAEPESQEPDSQEETERRSSPKRWWWSAAVPSRGR